MCENHKKDILENIVKDPIEVKCDNESNNP